MNDKEKENINENEIKNCQNSESIDNNPNLKKFSETEVELLCKNITLMVDNIAAAVDTMPEECDDNDVPADTKATGNKTSPHITDDLLSTPLDKIVSQIQVNDEIDADNNMSENKIVTTTFEMTEVANSVSINPINATSQISEDLLGDVDTLSPKLDSIINDNEEFDIKYTDDQLNKAYLEFETQNALPSYLMRDQLLGYARQVSLQYIIDEDYDKAKENDYYVDKLLQAYKNNGFNCFSDYNYPGIQNWNNLKTNLESRLEIAKKHQIDNNTKFKERTLSLKNEEIRRLNELEQIHKEELQSFINSCSSPQFLHRFSKPSSKLLQLRQLQKNLALQHYFNEAKSIKIKADELQKIETKAARLRASECVKKMYKTIIEKQFNQKNCLIENSERKRQKIEDIFIKENDISKNLTNQLELRINEMNQKMNSNSLPTSCTNNYNYNSDLNVSLRRKGKSAPLSQSISNSNTSTLPSLNQNPVRSKLLYNNLKRKRKMINQAQKISKLDVRLTDFNKIIISVKKPVPTLSTVF